MTTEEIRQLPVDSCFPKLAILVREGVAQLAELSRALKEISITLKKA